jgi:hypothetical protein
MLALELTTPRANGQHLVVPIASQSRHSRCGKSIGRDRLKSGKEAGMAERAVC